MNFKGIEKSLVQLIKILLYFVMVLIMIYLICNIYNWIISWFFNEIKIKDKFMYLFGEMDIKHQIALPFFVGIIGSFSTSLIMLLKGQTDVKITLFNGSLEILNWIVAVITECLLGGIAGVGAVNNEQLKRIDAKNRRKAVTVTNSILARYKNSESL